MPTKRLSTRDRARVMLLVGLTLTLLLYAVPILRYLAYPLLLLSTLAHEMGHGLAALLVGGSFLSFNMWPDGSGVARWAGGGGRLEGALVAIGGLIGPAIAAAIGFAAGKTERGARRLLVFSGVFLTLSFVLFVRNPFAWLFVGLLAAFCFWIATWKRADLAQLVVIFLALQLALSVFSRGDYLFTASAETGNGPMPSDVAQIAAALFLPFWFWGALCGAVSIVVLGYGIKTFWK